ncbi:electron transfer flavoprotein subunit alpha [Enterococcus florum]|uniref:Electron transfer flavoprotein subunit alpha n=1 Tax=Enterococcus florum TaxID=2480627 RepID=A0A4P5P4D2_9ENTE|nr:electron transfer flavoprotein subunit alpha/FixB family protein [Enterococcus florum]GCF92665.1 electron transfer flavoprotein subunit alpha [Enterococcus florum]
MNNTEHGLWVIAEQQEGQINEASFELLAKAVELKERSNQPITAILLGSSITAAAKQLLAYGADAVRVVDNDCLKQYKPRTYERVLLQLIERYRPAIVLFSATAQGRDLAPRVMCQLQTGLTADCLDLTIDDQGLLVQEKPSYGGNILCTIVIEQARPQMATVRPGVFSKLTPKTDCQGEIIQETVEVLDDEAYEVLESCPLSDKGGSISDAEIIVACGRGVKESNDLALINEFSALIHGEIACTRPLVDQGWFTHELQIGQSGTTVKPKLIINIGISGAVQYIVGIQNAQTTISINRNSEADIFSVSDYGITADYTELIPAVIREIKRRKQQE